MTWRRWLAVAIFVIAGGVHAWPDYAFEAFCGFPQSDGGRFRNHQNALPWDPDSSSRPRADPDHRSDDPCDPLDKGPVAGASMEASLAWLAGKGFVDPTVRLGPVLNLPWANVIRTDKPVVRFYLNTLPYRPMLGRDTPPALEAGQVVGACWREIFSTIWLNPDYFDLGDWVVQYVGAHELVHVLQQAQPVYQGVNECQDAPRWLTEGTADALAGAFVRSQPWFSNQRPAPFGQVSLHRNLLGLRSYRVSLLEDREFATVGPEGFARYITRYRHRNLPYGASSFWRFLVERYGKKDYGLLAKVMRTGPASVASPDWLRWLDAGFGPEGAWGIPHDLPIAFTSFLGSYADWGTSRWPHVGDATWRAFAFEGCHRVTLSPAVPSMALSVALEPYSGQCVEVTVDGLPTDQRAWYALRARDDVGVTPAAGLRLPGDDLHVAKVSWGGELVDANELTSCMAEEDATEPIVPACVVKRDAAANAYNLAYTLLTPERKGGTWTDVIVLVRAPTDPTDAEYRDLLDQEYRVTFSLEASGASVDGGRLGSVYGSGNDRPPGLRQMPVLAGEGVPGLDELDVSKLMFFQQAPGGLAAEFATPNAAGLNRVWLLESDDIDADDVGFLFTFTPEGAPIPYGATGAFTDWTLGGVDGRRFGTLGAMLGGERGHAVITVLAWTEDQLRVQARGDWCYADELDRDGKCAVTRSLDADLWLAFGDAYDGANPYFAVDTPMQAIYRDTFGRAVWGDFDFDDFDLDFDDFDFDFDDADAPTDGPGATGGSGGSRGVRVGDTPAFECACTCDMLAEIDRLSESLDTSAPGAMELVMSIGTCAIRCGDEFALCED